MDPQQDGPFSEQRGCPKCGYTRTEVDKIATSGTGLSKLFDVQNRSFEVVSSANCGYSKLYKGEALLKPSNGDIILQSC